MALFFRGAYRLGCNIVLALFLYYCLFYFSFLFNAIRQAFSMALFVYSISHLRGRNVSLFFILNMIGASFHFSSVFYLLFGALWLVRITSFTLLLSVLMPVFAFAFYLMDFGGDLFKLMASLFGRGDSYIERWRDSFDVVQVLSRLVLFVCMGLVFLGAKDKLSRVMFVFYTIGFCVYILFLDYSLIATRVNMAFRILEVVAVSRVVGQFRDLVNRFVFSGAFVILYAIQFYTNISDPDNFYNLRAYF
jgi:hypothetical protein